jgi:hypothetical protein
LIVESKEAIISKLNKELVDLKNKSPRYSLGKESDYGYSSSKSHDTLSSSVIESIPNGLISTTETPSTLKIDPTKSIKSNVSKEQRALRCKSNDHYQHLSKSKPNDSLTLELTHTQKLLKLKNKLTGGKNAGVKSLNKSFSDTKSAQVESCCNDENENQEEESLLNKVMLDSDDFVDLDSEEKQTNELKINQQSEQCCSSSSDGLSGKFIFQKSAMASKLSSDNTIMPHVSNQISNNSNNSANLKLNSLNRIKRISKVSKCENKCSKKSASSSSNSSSSGAESGEINSVSPSVSVDSASLSSANSTSAHVSTSAASTGMAADSLALSKVTQDSEPGVTNECNKEDETTKTKQSATLNSSNMSSSLSSSASASPIIMSQSLTICEDDEMHALNKSNNDLVKNPLSVSMYSERAAAVAALAAAKPSASLFDSESTNLKNSQYISMHATLSRSSRLLNSILKISSTTASSVSATASSASASIASKVPTFSSVMSSASKRPTAFSKLEQPDLSKQQFSASFSMSSSGAKSSKSSYTIDQDSSSSSFNISQLNNTSLHNLNLFSHKYLKLNNYSNHEKGFANNSTINDTQNTLNSTSSIDSSMINNEILEQSALATKHTNYLLSREVVEKWTPEQVKDWLDEIGMLPVQIKSAIRHIRSGKVRNLFMLMTRN